MNIFDLFLALPLVAAVWVLLSNGVALFSLIKALLALAILFCALVFIDFPEGWTRGSLFYAPLMTGVRFLTGLWGATKA